MKHLPFITMSIVAGCAIEGWLGLDPTEGMSTGIFVLWILTFMYSIQEITRDTKR